MKILKDKYINGFLSPFVNQADIVYADSLNDIDVYLMSNYFNVIVDEFTYDTLLPNFIKIHDKEFSRIYQAINAEYNPINNYDMSETITKNNSYGDITKTTTTNGEKITDSVEHGQSTSVSTDKEAVIDNTALKISNENTTTITPDNYGTRRTENYNNYQNEENVTHEDDEETITTDRSGNIGVTTTQKMIESSFELESKYKFVQYVSTVFINELTTGVYKYD